MYIFIKTNNEAIHTDYSVFYTRDSNEHVQKFFKWEIGYLRGRFLVRVLDDIHTDIKDMLFDKSLYYCPVAYNYYVYKSHKELIQKHFAELL